MMAAKRSGGGKNTEPVTLSYAPNFPENKKKVRRRKLVFAGAGALLGLGLAAGIPLAANKGFRAMQFRQEQKNQAIVLKAGEDFKSGKISFQDFNAIRNKINQPTKGSGGFKSLGNVANRFIRAKPSAYYGSAAVAGSGLGWLAASRKRKSNRKK